MGLTKRKAGTIVGGLALFAAVSVLELAYTAPLSPYTNAVLDSRPAAYWSLDDLNGPLVRQTIDGAPVGRYRGAIGLGTAGPIDSSGESAVQFNGHDGAIELRTPGAGVAGSSLAFWLRPDDGAATGAVNASWRPLPESATALWPWLVASQASANESWTATFTPPDRLSVDYRPRNDRLTTRYSISLAAGRFSFVVLTFGRRLRVWVDGGLATAVKRAIPSAREDAAAPLTFGGGPGAGVKRFVGTIDNIAAFARQLTGGEIRRLWRVARARCRACGA